MERGDFGLASGRQPGGDGAYGRAWFNEPVPVEEIAFESGVFLLRKDRAAALGAGPEPGPGAGTGLGPGTGIETRDRTETRTGLGTGIETGARFPRFLRSQGLYRHPHRGWTGSRTGTRHDTRFGTRSDGGTGLRTEVRTPAGRGSGPEPSA